MKGIVTLRNDDGSYDGVGMNNKSITAVLKTTQGVRNQAYNFALGRKRTAVKIEFYGAAKLYSLPFAVEEWEHDGKTWKQKQKLARTK